MKLFPIVFILFFSTFVESNIDSALRECGNLHDLKFKNIPNAEAIYSNQNCVLKCSVGNATLSNDAINEGLPCPLDVNGTCRNGHCQVNVEIPTTHAPTTPSAIIASIFTTHRIEYFQLSIISANLSQPYTDLSAIACVGKKDDPEIKFELCRHICQTRKISTETSHPQFSSTNCYLYSQLVNDHLHVEVQHVGYYVLGAVNLNIHSLFEQNYNGKRKGAHSFVFERNFPIVSHQTVRMGSLDLKFNVYLAPKE